MALLKGQDGSLMHWYKAFSHQLNLVHHVLPTVRGCAEHMLLIHSGSYSAARDIFTRNALHLLVRIPKAFSDVLQHVNVPMLLQQSTCFASTLLLDGIFHKLKKQKKTHESWYMEHSYGSISNSKKLIKYVKSGREYRGFFIMKICYTYMTHFIVLPDMSFLFLSHQFPLFNFLVKLDPGFTNFNFYLADN